MLWGASFPLALAAVARKRARIPAGLVGRVYAANTIGAIAGCAHRQPRARRLGSARSARSR